MSDHSTPATPSRGTFLVVLPLIAFIGLALLFWFRLGSGDPRAFPRR